MSTSLSTPVSELPRVGPALTSRLRVLGIHTVQDLLLYYPFRHEDFRSITPIGSAAIGSTVTVKGSLELVRSRRSYRRKLHLTEGLVRDSTGALPVVWFNQPYLAKTLARHNGEYLVAGKIESSYGISFVNPVIEPASLDPKHLGRIVPVYPSTAGLSQRQLRTLLHGVLPVAGQLPEFIPEVIRTPRHLLDRTGAVRQIHFPDSPEHLSAATHRLKFEELFLVQLAALLARAESAGRAPIIRFNVDVVKGFVASLPFVLTDDQRRAAWEILRDLERDIPMARLLQGDVGSGKTAVAAIAAVNATASGFQAVLLSPTEVLATQHEETLRRLTKDVPLRVGLLTGSRRQLNGADVAKASLVAAVRKGTMDLLIGTHALLSTELRFAHLGLAVVDEQHRFGVEQRRGLTRLASGEQDRTPHLLSLSATPIPRSLALTLYGDLELSTLRHRPENRPPVTTQVLSATEEKKAFQAVRTAVERGEQAFVICPLVEESDALGVAAATQEFKRLSEGPLRDLRLDLLHGRMSGKKKTEALRSFTVGKTAVLVATPVVEVGIDVPNATVMVIEGAERFGLAQLHQLRGRVGRGPKPSICFLLGDTTSPTSKARLTAVAETNDGFVLAERDLELRGPGQRYGLAQSGLPDFRMATLGDTTIATEASKAAREVLAADPKLNSSPALRAALNEVPTTISES